MRRTGLVPLYMIVLVAGFSLAIGGDITPPPGPVTSTMKPLSEIEPRVAINATNTPGDAESLFAITEPGSYYLAENVHGEAGKNGIRIAADGVTLDLNGFAVIGTAGSLDGITVPVTQLNLAILNGTIRDWGANGINAQSAQHSQFDALRASNNSGVGLSVGNGAVVTNCIASTNAGTGIAAASGGVIAQCTAYENSGTCGIYAYQGGTITACAAYNNGQHGIGGGPGTAVSACTAYGNDSCGIDIDAATACNCTANDNDADGIKADVGCLVVNCTVWDNVDDGIDIDDDGTVRNCNAYSNNNGAGIYARGGNIRIEGNNLTNNATGIESDGFNFIIQNHARGNTTNYDFATSDRYGAVITATAGFSSSNAWANFED